MTTQTQIQGLGEFAWQGFTLQHPDDHVVVLLHEGEVIASFSQLGATEASLQEECAKHLIVKHDWDGRQGINERRKNCN
ncbi:unnamed protein product [marine sediment metagenome]|uniref:Uncharacterized protein n=1 Tax=marine sediment metagenome TaxID=412755 RepID=X1KLF0_9ZZZZ